MRPWPVVLAFLAILPLRAGGPLVAVVPAVAQTGEQEPKPPVAERRPVRLTAHGIERTDDYAWLRDPNWRDVM